MTSQQHKRGVIKQVLSGDSVVIRAAVGAPPPEKTLFFSSVLAPKLARRGTDALEVTKDEPFAWEAREFLRKKLIGEDVWFTAEKPPNSTREYGTVYLGKDLATAENITEALVSEGLVTVRREGLKAVQENAQLIELEEAAKSAGRGKWGSDAAEHIRDIKWTVDKHQNYIDKNAGTPIKAVVEHVRDGSTVRLFLIPDCYHITLMISGIRAPGFKLDENGRPDPTVKVPFSEEARYFVEVRLLQRDVEVILESVNANNFVGTILYPKGNIAELLLKEGLAKCVDWSMKKITSGADKLRAAERKAKESHLRLWKDWQPNTPQLSGKEKDFTGTVVEIINGDALSIKYPNGRVKKIFLSSIRPPKEAGRGAEEDGKPAQRPKGFRPLYDIPWMYDAREYLRKKLIGKKVHVAIDYIQEAKDNFPEKTCATVTIGGLNVAEALLSKGLATVVNHRQDDDQRSSHYDELRSAESKAIKSAKGIHSKKESPLQRVIEIDAIKAKQYFPSFQRAQRVDAIVEFVASGSRLRLFIPKEHCLCTFLLAGISCPRGARPPTLTTPASEAEPFGEEALAFTKERCLQHEVSISVDALDKAGNFIGWLWIENVNLSVALIEEGFAAMHPNADRSEYFRQLKTAEDTAKQKNLKRWKDHVEEQEEEQRIELEQANPERKVHLEEVVVTEVTVDGTFFAQSFEQGPKAETLNMKIRQEFHANPPLPGSYTPKRGDICAAKYSVDDEWYRVKVEKLQGSNAAILYIDYGNREVVNTTKLASLPAAFTSEKPFAFEYSLACVNYPKDPELKEDAMKIFRQVTSVNKLLLNVEYRLPGTPPAASLYFPDANEDSKDVVKSLIVDGWFVVDNRRERRLQKLVSDYKDAEAIARRDHVNIWEYGDIREDDAREFGLAR